MIALFLAAFLLAAPQPPPVVLVPQSPPGPSVSAPETAAAARAAFRAWLAAEMAQCASEPQSARRRLAKVQFDLLQPRLVAVLGQEGASDALRHVIMDDRSAIVFPDCPAPDAIDTRMADFESAIGRLTAALYAGDLMPFRPAQ